ncbi:NAD(P)H-dependent oxidoreductase [Aureivirga sp. CE67]|uniref:NAD(P)H-dependent oxidoreductase n=1 Tax=Aureivirga sp. CE67 TaxID=1788983 RepID=UPI0018CAAD2B|nr:NAD(P)H-dependent oxidoreductase [Aureivirga sp. CE67]
MKEDFLNKLRERYACKAMNGEKIEEEVVERILEAARLAPTSSGLQPFEIFVITDQEVKEKIRPVSWNQSQITDCSHLLVFAAWDTYTEDRINYMFDLTNEIRGFKNEGWENYRQQLLAVYPNQDANENFHHAAKQAYIAMMAAITQATYEGVDSVPVEGFTPNDVDEILGLKEKGLRSAVMLPLGYKDADNDWLVNLKKVRKPMDKLVTRI